MTTARPEVGLFVTCLVDIFRPTVGFAAVKLLQGAGCKVTVPEAQTCCGQPAYNSGDRADARAIARAVIAAFQGFDYVVVPSGSCGGMIKLHYPALFAADPGLREAAADLAHRTYELVSFLTDVLGVDHVDARFDGNVTYHDSCSALRELNVFAQPRKLLDSVAGLHRTELANADVCCGFGGTFCVKYSEISADIVRKKADSVVASGAGTLLSTDMGCLLNIAGKLQRDGSPVAVRHVAEVLAGTAGRPGIGAARR